MGEPSQEIFDVVRAGDTGRLQALLTANPSLANARNERGHSPVLIAQYHHKNEAVAVLLAARPELDIFDAASVGDTSRVAQWLDRDPALRSEEHTSELQSQSNLVCRLLLEKKTQTFHIDTID